MLKIILIIISICFISNCFGAGIYKQGSVIGLKENTVKTIGGAFQIGSVPDYWQEKKIKFRAVYLINSKDRSSITIDSWCRESYDDSSLTALTEQLFRGITRYKVSGQQTLKLAERDALMTEAQGNVDGRDIFLSSYVLKMNHCVFDFVYISVPEHMDYYSDFKNIVLGFKYLKGPELL